MASACPVQETLPLPESERLSVFEPGTVADVLNPFRIRAGLSALVPEQERCPIEPDRVPRGWMCTYSFGISLWEMRRMFGCNVNGQPSFVGSPWDWWLQPEEATWASKRPFAKGQFCLVSSQGHFGSLSWAMQGQAIERILGSKFHRVPEAVYCEAFCATWLIQSVRRIGGPSIRPWSRYFRHWGNSLTSRGERVWIGLSRKGIEVGSCPTTNNSDPYLQVALECPPDPLLAEHIAAPGVYNGNRTG